MQPLVSIIMPAHNAEAYIGTAIGSVLQQAYANWELIIINDGSTDATLDKARQFTDPRIRVFNKTNGGVSSARNMALDHVQGELLCGLDADDLLPPGSLDARVQLLIDHPEVDAVDGLVHFEDATMENVLRVYRPSFNGEPYHELLALTGSCYMGFSWMIRWQRGSTLRFDTALTHGEDLCFYMAYSPGKQFRHVDQLVLRYRRTGSTAMTHLDGSARSYARIHTWLRAQRIATSAEAHLFRARSRSIMMKSYIRAFRPWRALQTLCNSGPFRSSAQVR